MPKKSPRTSAIKDMHLSSAGAELLEDSVEVFERIDEIIIDEKIVIRKIMRVIKVK
jgi:hypothetical protein